MLDVSDYELVWAPDLFAAEARRILARSRVDPDAVDLLLREAFRDDSAAEDAASLAPFGSRDSGGIVSLSSRDALAGLADVAHSIPRFSAPGRTGRSARGKPRPARTWMP
jgi:hypothetical protein